MSDYLSTLIARTHNPTEVIQPRLALLFEPSPVVGGLGAGPFPGVQRLDVAPRADAIVLGALTPAWPLPHPPLEYAPAPQPSVPDPSVRLDAPNQPLESAHPRSSLSITDQPTVPNTPSRSGPDRATPPQVTPSSAAGATPPHSPAEPSPQARLETTRTPSVEPATPLATVHPVRSATASAPQARLELPHVRVVVEQRTAPEEPRPFASTPAAPSPIQAARPLIPAMAVDESHVTPYVTPTQPTTTAPVVVQPPEPVLQIRTTRLTAPVPIVVQLHVTPHVQPAVPVAPAATSTPAPTIRVTIGRIDVRAIMPPAPPVPRTRPARSGPALSLDDYLKQRHEGRR